jgi:hypothetical protein
MTCWASSLASTFAQNLAGVQSDVLNDWAAYFRGWQRINQGLISGSDSALDQELNAEVKRLEGMRDSISGENASDTYWRQVLNEDIEDAKRLLS